MSKMIFCIYQIVYSFVHIPLLIISLVGVNEEEYYTKISTAALEVKLSSFNQKLNNASVGSGKGSGFMI